MRGQRLPVLLYRTEGSALSTIDVARTALGRWNDHQRVGTPGTADRPRVAAIEALARWPPIIPVDMSRAPRAVTPKILELARLATGHDVEPVFVVSTPEPGAVSLDSFAMVDGVVAERGGSRVVGWGILEQDWFLEAESRCLWRDPDGELVDVTPPPFPMSGSLFVEDAARDDDAQQLDSVRLATTDHPAVDELLAAYADQFELYSRAERGEDGEIHLSEAEDREHAEILARGNRALRDLARATPPPPGRNDPCPCGSGRKYKKCHGA